VSLREHVTVVAPGLDLDRREALVAAARSRGESTSVDADLERAREQLAALDEPVPSLADARRQAAEAETDLESERERVATLRGRLQECEDDGDLERAYRAAIRDLSEAETERAAAREALEDAREQARVARDERERRLRLEDRVANLERQARAELVEAVRPAVDAAVEAAPGGTATAFADAAPVTAALALVRVGRVRVPVVLACRRFESVAAAEAWLEAPVYRL
jgi:chromosome segregation ATPase